MKGMATVSKFAGKPAPKPPIRITMSLVEAPEAKTPAKTPSKTPAKPPAAKGSLGRIDMFKLAVSFLFRLYVGSNL